MGQARCAGLQLHPGLNGWYGTFCGTSSAAPALAGIAGLLASRAPLASNTQIENALEATAVPLQAQVAYGRVDAYASLLSLGSAPTGSAPVNTAPPTIAGTAQDGQVLTASSGTWSGSPTGYAYQWRRCGATCTDLAGATGTSYAVGAADVGSTLSVLVTASNTTGSAAAGSAATAPVVAAPTSSSSTFTGTLNGKQPQQSFKLTVGAGTTKASLVFSKAPSLSLSVLDSSGKLVATASGPSTLTVTSDLAAGTYSFQVAGAPKSGCGFTLTVVYRS